MKKHILILIVLAFLLLTGCQKAPEATAPTEITTVVYTLTYIDSGMISYDAEAFLMSGSIELNSDGTATLYYEDQIEELLYSEDQMWSEENEDVLHSYTISGQVLVMDYYGDTLTFVHK